MLFRPRNRMREWGQEAEYKGCEVLEPEPGDPVKVRLLGKEELASVDEDPAPQAHNAAPAGIEGDHQRLEAVEGALERTQAEWGELRTRIQALEQICRRLEHELERSRPQVGRRRNRRRD